MNLCSDCCQEGHQFASVAFLEAWATAADFPSAWARAERGCLVDMLGDDLLLQAELKRWKAWQPETDIYERDLNEYLIQPIAPSLIKWLRALARAGGQI